MNLKTKSIRSHDLLEHIREKITSGELNPGQRLPSLRELSRRFKTSIGLVQSCFRQLEDDGFVVQKHGSGTFVNPDLKFSGSKLIGLITSYGRNDIEDYFEPLFQIAADRRVVPMVGCVNFRTDWKQTVKDIMMVNPHGILIDVAVRGFDLDELMSLVRKTPFCFCNRWEWFPRLPEGRAVLIDYIATYAKALNFLIEAGHKTIAVAHNNNPPFPHTMEHMQRALAMVGSIPGLRLAHISVEELGKNAADVDARLRKSGASAMFAHSDYIAEYFRLNCPSVADMELVGVFNQHHSRQQGHEFSSFDPCFEQIWEKAFDILEQPDEKIIYIKPEFIMRSHKVLQNI
ncbi:MAG: GntR family transcriptional regulator [Victivallales bacterium]|nr:GntR family transcriptional regulator [Victivallales bacterium]